MLLEDQRALAELVARLQRHGADVVTDADLRMLATLARSRAYRRLDREVGRSIAQMAGAFDAARSVPEASRLLLRLLVPGADHDRRRGSSTRLITPAPDVWAGRSPDARGNFRAPA
ncbi:hypothetical protein [Capillimicrobium parvum]|uniref:Uncharacterized protein n=1 Tax=Capillimicrobium parvum TaxID=2884022 RepID=A0A9E7C3G1_9ACTN|nr:hypothetical protein [Capillimicrobium parvum]UGS38398.1 hypothetical protein DSM104329_04824 [Capillimicrobium parvum]